MSDKHSLSATREALDRKIGLDWQAVLRRFEDVNSRSGGDSRRQAILERFGSVKRRS